MSYQKLLQKHVFITATKIEPYYMHTNQPKTDIVMQIQWLREHE